MGGAECGRGKKKNSGRAIMRTRKRKNRFQKRAEGSRGEGIRTGFGEGDVENGVVRKIWKSEGLGKFMGQCAPSLDGEGGGLRKGKRETILGTRRVGKKDFEVAS